MEGRGGGGKIWVTIVKGENFKVDSTKRTPLPSNWPISSPHVIDVAKYELL